MVTPAVWVWAAAMVVSGATTCPSPADVTSALASLLPVPGASGAVEARAELVDQCGALRLRLLGTEGRVLSEKSLPREGSCAVMADTAAVVLAAWAARLNADVPLAFEAPRPAAASGAPSPEPRTPAPLLPPVQTVMDPATAAPRDPGSRRWVVSLAAGLFASLQDPFGAPTSAPAGSVELRLREAGDGWGGRLALAATGSHEQALGPGRAVWRRLGSALGAFRHSSWGRVSLDGGIDLVAALLFVEGDGFTTVRDLRTWDFGAGGNARLGLDLGRVEPWVAVGGTVWLRSQLVEVTGVAGQQRLSRLEVLAGAGLTVLLSD